MIDDDRRIHEAERLTRIEAKIDAILEDKVESKKRLDNHAERIRSLENSRSWAMGAGAAFGAISGWLTAKLGGHS